MFYGGARGLVALVTLGVFGLILIWKGISGDFIVSPRLGDKLIPRWLYIIVGLALLVFPVIFILVISKTI